MAAFDDFSFRVAGSAEHAAVMRFRTETYMRDHGHAPRDHLDAEAIHLVAFDKERQIISTARLLGPAQRPFDIEAFIDLDDAVGCEGVPALLGVFCIDPGMRQVSTSLIIQVGMLKLTTILCREMGVTDVFMYSFPWLVRFYRSASFEQVGRSFYHAGFKTPVHIMKLDVGGVPNLFVEGRAHLKELFDRLAVERC